jgi:CubicO group peptidase (beta-lactamase class C family)
MKRTLITSLIASFICLVCCSQNVDKIHLDAYFDTLARNDKFMGSVAVFKNKELIYSKYVGFADIEHGIKANENTKYRIASISKTFTAVLILKAIDDNKLNLNQPIDKFFPTIINADKITITHLLYHRSGIHNFPDDIWLDWNTQFKTEQEMIDIIAKSGSDFEPDSKASYSNINYILLSHILEEIHEKPYSKILEEQIIKPIGLKNTYYGGNINTVNNECNSYKFFEIFYGNNNTGTGYWKIAFETDLSLLLGCAGIVSTPIDLNLFSEALFNGKLVSTNSLNQMKTIKDSFGMGLFQMPFNDKTSFGHPGGIDGFASMFAYFPASNISFSLTANGMNCKVNDIANAVLSAVSDKPFEIPNF